MDLHAALNEKTVDGRFKSPLYPFEHWFVEVIYDPVNCLVFFLSKCFILCRLAAGGGSPVPTHLWFGVEWHTAACS